MTPKNALGQIHGYFSGILRDCPLLVTSFILISIYGAARPDLNPLVFFEIACLSYALFTLPNSLANWKTPLFDQGLGLWRALFIVLALFAVLGNLLPKAVLVSLFLWPIIHFVLSFRNDDPAPSQGVVNLSFAILLAITFVGTLIINGAGFLFEDLYVMTGQREVPYFKDGVSIVNFDPLTARSFASMINNYGTMTSGIHGTLPFNYHMGFFFIVSAVSNVTGLAPIYILIPTFAGVISPLLVHVLQQFCQRTSLADLAKPGWVGLLAVAAFMWMHGPDEFHNDFQSESQVFGTTLLIIFLGWLGGPERLAGRRCKVDILLLPLFIAAISFSKISTGLSACFIYAAYFLVQILRDPRQAPFLEALLAVVFALFAVSMTKMPSAGSIPIQWTESVLCSPGEPDCRSWFQNFWYTIALGVLFILVNGNHKKAINNFEQLFAYAAISALLAQWIIHYQFLANGGSSYFASTAKWVSLAIGCLALGEIMVLLAQSAESYSKNLRRAVILAPFALLAWTLVPKFQQHGKDLVEFQKRRPVIKQFLFQHGIDDHDAFSLFVEELAEIGMTKNSKEFVYIPQDENTYWEKIKRKRCTTASQIAIALSRRALLFGVSQDEHQCSRHYETRAWLGKSVLQEKHLSPEILCSEVKRFAGDAYISLTYDAKSHQVVRKRTNC